MDDEEDRPEDSAGAQCIRFKLLTYQFGPKFVHQVFPDELIPGYLPQKVKSSTSTRPSEHPSFRGRHAPKYLTILVKLTASCQYSSLTLDASPIPVAVNPHKRRRLNNCEDNEEDIGSEDSETDEDDLNSQVEASADEEEWTLDQVRAALAPFLPPPSPNDGQSQFLPAPIGIEKTCYTTHNQSFLVSIATAAQCWTYHRAVQKLAYWFIDAASDIEITPESTEWKVFYLFRKHENDAFSLVGFMTLYHFSSPFRKPVGGCIVRVCQALVLPPYQRMGHGQKMLESVFHYAQSQLTNSSDPIVEVNCEDPAPAFQILRNVVDYHRFVVEGRKWFKDPSAPVIAPPFGKPLRESLKAYALKQSLTTPTQILKVYEIDALTSIPNCSDDVKDLSLMQKYKALVRSRLEKDHADELGDLEKNEATVRLKELLSAELAHHETTIRRVHEAKAQRVQSYQSED